MTRQPVHTVYGGAHLFKANIAQKLGAAALKTLDEHAPDETAFAGAVQWPVEFASRIYPRIVEKLKREPVEDFRIDFEDGFGIRPDEEEDSHAQRAAEELASGLAADILPPAIGIRIKPLSEVLRSRSLRTLDLFLDRMLERTFARLPARFVVTLPKITAPDQVAALASHCEAIEHRHGLQPGAIRVELMVETTQSIFAVDGTIALPRLVAEGRGRVLGAHFGTYDYTAACDITAMHQDMLHPACQFAKHVMQVALAGTPIQLADGATNILPVGPRDVVHRAWRLHMEHIRHSLVTGFYQGWDLHPAQLPTRYAAVYGFFLEGLEAASERLRAFVAKAAQATLAGDVFDDAATGQGLLNYFLRALNCGAMTETEAAERSGLGLDELRSRSFVTILGNRRGVPRSG
jgi:citrate lyase beta subunit